MDKRRTARALVWVRCPKCRTRMQIERASMGPKTFCADCKLEHGVDVNLEVDHG